MHKESFVMGVAGVLLGLLAGWIIGSQQAAPSRDTAASAPAAQSATPPAGGQQPVALDENRAATLRSTAEANPKDAATRTALGNLYFDAGRFEDAARWYDESLKINPNDANVSTDLGITFYYMNEADRALAQFERSLAIDAKHSKTLLNIGIVRAWGKQDLDGAAKAWQRVIDVAPNSEEAARAKQGLDGIRAAHPDAGTTGGQKPAGSPK
jgi:tetratricopeptide (TPR) repeat protein